MLTNCFGLLAGSHTGDLEIQYEQGDLVYASLTGQCAEVDVQLSQEVVSLHPTYVNTQSQRCFRSAPYCTCCNKTYATRPHSYTAPQHVCNGCFTDVYA